LHWLLLQSTWDRRERVLHHKDYYQTDGSTNSRFSGKLIVVVWHHGNIPEFAQALHARAGDYPEEWKSSVYNQILQFDYSGTSLPKVTCLTEPF
jgi:hypothetical protein